MNLSKILRKLVMVALSILLSFQIMNINKCMKSSNGNVPKLLRVGHANLGSGNISNKLSDIDVLMYTKRPDILGISETVMDRAAIDILNSEGHQVEVKDDNERISVIIANNINYRRRTDLETALQPIIWLEMGTGSQKHLVGQAYREWKIPVHRKNTTQYHTKDRNDQRQRWNLFLDDWEKILDTEDCEVHLLGDMNLDRKKWRQIGGNPNPEVQDCVDDLFLRIMSRNVTQLVTDTTRTGRAGQQITESTLDLIFTNRLDKVKNVAVSDSTTSDHQYVEFRRMRAKDVVMPNQSRRRAWKKINREQARTDLLEVDREPHQRCQ